MAIPIYYNLRNLRVRKTTTMMTALGIALTVSVLLGISALVSGLRSALEVTGHPLHLIVMRQGSTSELVSIVPDDKFQVVKYMEGVAELEGEPMVSHEVISVVSLGMRGDPTNTANVNVRGVSPMGVKMRDTLELVSGRWYEEGKREVVVGRGCTPCGRIPRSATRSNSGAARGKWSACSTPASRRSTVKSGDRAAW